MDVSKFMYTEQVFNCIRQLIESLNPQTLSEDAQVAYRNLVQSLKEYDNAAKKFQETRESLYRMMKK